MAEFRAASPEQARLLSDLVAAGHVVPTGVDGVYGRGGVFEDIRQRFDQCVTRAAAAAGEDPEILRFPPVLPRRQLEELGYLGSFPHLAGIVFAFEGSEQQAREMAASAARHDDWAEHQHMSELSLVSAVC